MTDEGFVKRLQELQAAGDIATMREVLRGQMTRLIELAARGVGVRERKRKDEEHKRQIADGFPDATAKAAAIEYWQGKRRPDLVARVDEIAEQFHTHHFVRNARFVSWGMVWKTWYVRSVSIERPPQGVGLSAVVTFSQTNIAGWQRRLEIYHCGDEEGGVPPGTWSPTYGPEPGAAGCRVPAEAMAAFPPKMAVNKGGRLPGL